MVRSIVRWFAVLMIVASAACGSPDEEAGEAPVDEGARAAAAQGAPAVSGRVVTAAGDPVSGAQIEIVGTLSSKEQYLRYEPRTDADGRYRAEVDPGEYAVSGSYMTDYHGQRYTFDLHPQGGDDSTVVVGDGEVQRDFVWQISGRRAGAEGAGDQADAFYGGSVDFSIYDVFLESPQTTVFAAEFPQGFEARVELIPEGPLIDGSQGAPITVTRTLSGPYDAEGWGQVDVPIGQYRIQAAAAEPDGSSKPLEVIGVALASAGATGALAQRQNPPVLLTFPPTQSGVGRLVVALAYGPPYDPLN